MPNTRTRKKRRLPWESKFLEALSSEPNIAGACRTAEIGRTTAYDHRHADPDFAAAWQEALDESVDELVGSCYRRAMKDSDTLAIFLLKCHRPDVYAERQQVDMRITADVKYQQDLDTAYADDDGPTAEE